jgi:hypothetical protein
MITSLLMQTMIDIMSVPGDKKFMIFEEMMKDMENLILLLTEDMTKYGESYDLMVFMIVLLRLRHLEIFENHHVLYGQYVLSMLYYRRTVLPSCMSDYMKRSSYTKRTSDDYIPVKGVNSKTEVRAHMAENLMRNKTTDPNLNTIITTLSKMTWGDVSDKPLKPLQETWSFCQELGFILGGVNKWASLIAAMIMATVIKYVKNVFASDSDGKTHSDDSILRALLPMMTERCMSDLVEEDYLDEDVYEMILQGRDGDYRPIDLEAPKTYTCKEVLRRLSVLIADGHKFYVTKIDGIKYIRGYQNSNVIFPAEYASWVTVSVAWSTVRMFGCRGSELKWVASVVGEMLQVLLFSQKVLIPTIRTVTSIVKSGLGLSPTKVATESAGRSFTSTMAGVPESFFVSAQLLSCWATKVKFSLPMKYNFNLPLQLFGDYCVSLADFRTVGSSADLIRKLMLSKLEGMEWLKVLFDLLYKSNNVWRKCKQVLDKHDFSVVLDDSEDDDEGIDTLRIDWILCFNQNSKTTQNIQLMINQLGSDKDFKELLNDETTDNVQKLRDFNSDSYELILINKAPFVNKFARSIMAYTRSTASSSRLSISAATVRKGMKGYPNRKIQNNFNGMDEVCTISELVEHLITYAKSVTDYVRSPDIELLSRMEDRVYAGKMEALSTRYSRYTSDDNTSYWKGSYRTERFTPIVTLKPGLDMKEAKSACAVYYELAKHRYKWERDINKRELDEINVTLVKRALLPSITEREATKLVYNLKKSILTKKPESSTYNPPDLKDTRTYKLSINEMSSPSFGTVLELVREDLNNMRMSFDRMQSTIELYLNWIVGYARTIYMSVPEGGMNAFLRSRKGSSRHYLHATGEILTVKSDLRKVFSSVSSGNVRIEFIALVSKANRMSLDGSNWVGIGFTENIHDFHPMKITDDLMSSFLIGAFKYEERTGLSKFDVYKGSEGPLYIDNIRKKRDFVLYAVMIDGLYLILRLDCQSDFIKDTTKFMFYTNTTSTQQIIILQRFLIKFVLPDKVKGCMPNRGNEKNAGAIYSLYKGNMSGDVVNFGILAVNKGESSGNLPITYKEDIWEAQLKTFQELQPRIFNVTSFNRGNHFVTAWVRSDPVKQIFLNTIDGEELRDVRIGGYEELKRILTILKLETLNKGTYWYKGSAKSFEIESDENASMILLMPILYRTALRMSGVDTDQGDDRTDNINLISDEMLIDAKIALLKAQDEITDDFDGNANFVPVYKGEAERDDDDSVISDNGEITDVAQGDYIYDEDELVESEASGSDGDIGDYEDVNDRTSKKIDVFMNQVHLIYDLMMVVWSNCIQFLNENRRFKNGETGQRMLIEKFKSLINSAPESENNVIKEFLLKSIKMYAKIGEYDNQLPTNSADNDLILRMIEYQRSDDNLVKGMLELDYGWLYYSSRFSRRGKYICTSMENNVNSDLIVWGSSLRLI